jgi:hypothetical protein
MTTRSRAMVWGGHVSRSAALALLAVHVAALAWLCADVGRLRLIGYDFTELASEAEINEPPQTLRTRGYSEDSPADLLAFRSLAEPVVSGSSNDAERMRRLGDYIYSLRLPGAPDLSGPRDQPLTEIFAILLRGDHGSCGEMSRVLAAFWRSLGGHTRAVRWATADGRIGHDAVELYSTGYRRWVYYDMNLNGFGQEDDDTPLSIASLRAKVLTDEDVHLVENPRAHDWNGTEFRAALRTFPVEWYALNNRLLYFEKDRRFGALSRLSPLLSRLPAPIDRFADQIFGDRDRRMVIKGKIEIAGIFTFEGARGFLAYLLAIIVICGATMVWPLAAGAGRTIAARIAGRRVRFRDEDVPRVVNSTR